MLINKWRTVSQILQMVLFLAGIFTILIASHETYHYFTIKGAPTGICLGKCYLGDSYSETDISDTWTVAGITWEFTAKPILDLNKEELRAWGASLAFTASFLSLLWYSSKQ